MTGVFSAAIDAIFDDPEMAADGIWTSATTGERLSCRVIRKMPDDAVSFGRSSARVVTMLGDVRVREVPVVAKNDLMDIGDERFKVSAAPSRDRDRLIWTLELEAAP